ncbi:MAG: hypothetical protein BZ135_08790 [Methanosphaera sp. rholeuAM6]|nr:MAG: hypothetical protein BZ135_08790 [Methanosphaera sp. rholeuAM6]
MRNITNSNNITYSDFMPSKRINLEIKDNILLIHIKTHTTREYTLFINGKEIDNIMVDNEFTYEYPLKYVFTKYLKVKVVSKDETFTGSIERTVVSYTKGLKKSMLGKDNQFFLVNDKNQDLRQHYDKHYTPHMNVEEFKKSVKSKQEYFSHNNIKYGFFVVPDKCITLRKYLPFETDTPHRYVDKLEGYVTDLHPIITKADTLFNDTHITMKSSLKVVPFILSLLHGQSPEHYRKMLDERSFLIPTEHEGDLFAYKNWSYQRDRFHQENSIMETESVELKDEYEKVNPDEIPAKFRYVSIRQSRHYRNKNSVLDKKAIVIHDSTTEQLLNTFIATYREVFFYWDHWYFNRDLVEWFKPDDVIEIRTERFLENPLYPIVDEDYTVNYPITISLEDYDVDCDSLKFTLNVTDYCRMPVESNVKVFIDEVKVNEGFYKSPIHMKLPLSSYSTGDHELRIVAFDTNGQSDELCRSFPLYEGLDSMFDGLKITLKGKKDTFFRVHDRNSEILQHYDRTYTPRIDADKFNECMAFKRSFATGRNVSYSVFCIPDKSIILREHLPFNTVNPIRVIDKLDDVNDLSEYLTGDDYLLNDTKLSDESCIRLVAYMLSIACSDESADEYEKKILERVDVTASEHRGNLFTSKAWSYDEKLKDKYYSIPTMKVSLKNSFVEVDTDNIPVESRQFGSIKSRYYRNDNAVLDMKAIILHDSSINPMIVPLIASFKEVFFYWDQWYFNKHLLDWFDASVILEIREESSFENPVYPVVSEIDEIRIPTTERFTVFEVRDNVLYVQLEVRDLKNLPVNTGCKFIIDEKAVFTDSITDSTVSFCHDLVDLSTGEHTLKIVIEAGKTTRAKVLKKHFTKGGHVK